MPIGEPASIGRKTSEWKLSINADVSTVQDTYETVYSFTGAGILDAIAISCVVTTRLKCIIEVTVDGGTLYEIDMGVHLVLISSSSLWAFVTRIDENYVITSINAEFKSSILIRAKNDTDTSVLGIGISSSEDQ